MVQNEPLEIRKTIRRHQLREMVPLADSTIYEMEQRGEFPRRFALSPRLASSGISPRSTPGCWRGPRKANPSRTARARHQAQVPPSQRAGSSAIDGITVGSSVGTYFRPSTQASTVSAHSCIMWRRCTSYSALL